MLAVPEPARRLPQPALWVQLRHVSDASQGVFAVREARLADNDSGMSLIMYSPHRILRVLAPLYPILILLVIMVSGAAIVRKGEFVLIHQATANHYLFDAVGGFFVTLLAYKINKVLLNLRPIEEWFFWVIRTERPMDKAKYEAILYNTTGREREANRPLMTDSA